MLVLARKVGQSVVVGVDKDITVTLISVRGTEVKLGINAPRSVPVYREELLDLGKETKVA